MELEPIAVDRLRISPFALLAEQWLVLACGDFSAQSFNAMTVSWGSVGRIWEKSFVQVVVRPTRYTFEFMEKYDTFTLSAFPKEYQPKLSFLGSHSGRDGDKIKESGLTPIASQRVVAPSFREAELVVECRKIYQDDLDPKRFLDPAIETHYPKKDYHRAYFGEIVALRGINAYRA